MTGTLLNVAGIIGGGIAGMTRSKPLSHEQESFIKILVGAFTVFYGLRLVWLSINGTFVEVLKQLLVLLLSLMLGKLTGRLLHLQKLSNKLGQAARELIEETKPEDPDRVNRGVQDMCDFVLRSSAGIPGGGPGRSIELFRSPGD